MSTLLVTPKEKGNTYDVVSYVKNNSGAEFLVLDTHTEALTLKKFNIIIICTGVYGDNMHKSLRSWLMDIDKTSLHENVKFYAFLTWIGRGKSDEATIKKIRTILENKELTLEDDYISCFGKFLRIRNIHPNEEDYQKVLTWVKSKLN